MPPPIRLREVQGPFPVDSTGFVTGNQMKRLWVTTGLCFAALAGLYFVGAGGRDAASQEWPGHSGRSGVGTVTANSRPAQWPHSPQTRPVQSGSVRPHSTATTDSQNRVRQTGTWAAATTSRRATGSSPVHSGAVRAAATPGHSRRSPSRVTPAGHQRRDPNLAYAYTAVTPKGRVTANEWAGPKSRPLQPIQQTSYAHPPVEFEFEDSTPEQLLSPFEQRAAGYPGSIKLPILAGQLRELPTDYSPWWNAVVNQPMRTDLPALPVNIESLILNAMQHSPQVTAMRIDPVLRETVIVEQEAEFDWAAFVETTYDDNNDPIGNTLTTGDNNDRYTDRNVYARAGLRKRMDQGGEFDVSQRLGYQDTNSTFFVPTQQGTTRLEVNFTQPLLRGAGTIYNESRIVLALIDRNVSEDELAGRMQDHLVEVYRTYWTLYRARAVKLQKQRLLQRAVEIEKHLDARRGVDAIRRQILRARAAVASRRSEIVRAEMAIRNAESRLRLLVNSPELKRQAQVEMLPEELPMTGHLDISLQASIQTALQHRPEIARAIRQMKATSVRLGIARNELLPKLDFILGAYVAGLKGSGEIGQAWRNQYADGRPGFTVGFMLEFPLGNRAALARNERRQWEVAKAFREFEAAVESGMTDVELAVREMETSYQEMLSRFQAMLAAETEANYLMERWRHLPGSDQTISFLLEDLLDAQERVADEEAAFVNAQSDYVLAIVELKRATGVLLDCNCDTGSIIAPDRNEIHLPAPTPARAPAPALRPDVRPVPPKPMPKRDESAPPLPTPARPAPARPSRLELPGPIEPDDL